MKPICPLHNTEMFLLKGINAESGGFRDNYWVCNQRLEDGFCCKHTHPARNREEAEAFSPQQEAINAKYI